MKLFTKSKNIKLKRILIFTAIAIFVVANLSTVLTKAIPFSDTDPDIGSGAYSNTSITRIIEGKMVTFSGGDGAGGLAYDGGGLYAYDGTIGNNVKLTISVDSNYIFDIYSFQAKARTELVDVALTYADGSTNNFSVTAPIDTDPVGDLTGLSTIANVKQVVLTSTNYAVFQNIDIRNIRSIPPIPTVSTNAATNILASTATLNGTVNSNGDTTDIYFQYGTTNYYGSETNISIISSVSGNTDKSVNITGLTHNTMYHYRVVAKNGGGTVFGSDNTFTTTADFPKAPTIGMATAGNAQASVSFTPPSDDGGATITGYTVTASPGGVTGTGSSSPITVTGLTNGTAYTFTVTATNSVGTGAASSASNSVTPKAPQIITFNDPGNQDFNTNPTLSATSSSGLPVTFSSDTTSVATITSGGILTFVTPGTATIRAEQAGNSAYLPATPVTQSFTVNAVAPGAPTIGTSTTGDSQATVTFTAPSFTGGAAITGYTVTSSPAGGIDSNAGTTGLSHVITGLTNGTAYTFTVTATNSVGTGSASAASNSVTPKAAQTITFANPGAQNFGTTPTLTATASSGLTVTWTSDTPTVATIASDGTLTFLTTGTATIRAEQAGNSAYLPATTVTRSFAVNAVAPGAPTIGTATAGDTQATVTFTAPSFTGGAAITSYTVTSNPGGKTATGAASPLTVTGLTNGTDYTFTVTATNSAGTGLASAASNIVVPKAAQTITFANPGAQNFGTTPTLTATASSGLTVTWTSDTPTVATIASDGTLTFLTTGTATIRAEQAGNSAYLAATPVTQSFTVNAVVPAVPTIGTATAGDTQATVTFTAPSFTGGAAITGYTVTATPTAGGSDITATGATSPITVTGLTNGVNYTFTVKATNSVGTGSASSASNSVTPMAAPTYTISLTPLGSHAFPAQIVGYPSIAEKFITIVKTGTGNITGLSAVLSGVSKDSFTLGTLASTTINSSSTSSAFSVKPKDGLPVGNYNAAVDVIGDNGVSQSVNISFTVNSTPTPPEAPISDLNATAGDGQVTLTFTAPTGATSVIVEKATIGVTFVTATTASAITAASTSAVVTGLTNEVTYSFRLVVTGGSHAGISNVTTATPISAAPLVTPAPSEPSITVVNNVEGTPDIVTVTGLNAGDIIKVYDELTAGRLLGIGTVAAGQTSITINIAQLGMNVGNVYVSITSTGKIESARTQKSYAAEIRNSSISMSAAGFDKNISAQADLNVVITFNGNTLTNIKNGTNTLVNGTDYVVSGNAVTIKKGYLASQSLGNTVLTFTFSSGNTETMIINIVDTTTSVPNKDDNTTGGGSTSGGSTSGGGSAGGNSTTTVTTETRTVDVVAGTGADSTAAPVKVEITRTVESGSKTDTVKLDETKIAETIGKALETNKDVATVLVTDLKDNPADLVEIQVPKISSSKLAESGVAIKIETSKATVQIPSETLKSLGGDVKITMKEVTDASKINDTKALVLKTVGDSKVVENPVEVETNYSGRTEITIPLKTENLPKDPAELKKVLDSLAIQIHHSDGENATQKGTIVYDGKGNPLGVSIWVDKFSTFTVIALSKDGMDKLTANNGLISDRAAQNGSNNNSGANNNTDISNVQVPEIKFVGLEHSPLIEGDKEGFIISSGFEGNVQYRIYLNVDGAWQEVTNGYSAAVSGKEIFSITPDYIFRKGQYQGRVYVKKAGTAGSKQEDGIDFDNYYTYNINCVDRDDANRVYTVGNLNISKAQATSDSAASKAETVNDSFKAGEKVTITGIDGISGIPGPYYYRLHIYDVANDTWTNNVIPYSEKLEWTPSAAGTYVLDVHVITPNSVLWDKVQNDPTLIYGGYEGWKLKAIKVN